MPCGSSSNPFKETGILLKLKEFVNDVGSLAVPLYDEKGRLLLTLSATFFVKSFPQVREHLLADFRQAMKPGKKYVIRRLHDEIIATSMGRAFPVSFFFWI